MDQKKILGISIKSLITTAILLIIAVITYDRFAIVDHFFDFHLNEDAIREESNRLGEEKRDRDRRTKDWCDDIRKPWEGGNDFGRNDDRGTTGPPDRDR